MPAAKKMQAEAKFTAALAPASELTSLEKMTGLRDLLDERGALRDEVTENVIRAVLSENLGFGRAVVERLARSRGSPSAEAIIQELRQRRAALR